MELKTYKYINNTKQLPGFEDGRDWATRFTPPAPITPSFTATLLQPNPLTNYNLGRLSGQTDAAKRYMNSKPISNDVKNMVDPVTPTIGAAADIYNGFQYENSADDLRAQLRRYSSSVAGVGYTAEDIVKREDVMDEVKKENRANTFKSTASTAAAGAAIGTMIAPGIGTVAGGIIGGIGGLVGGLFGGKSRKEKARRAIEEAQQQAYANNEFERSGALTKALQIKEANGYVEGKQPIDTAFGMMHGTPNARTSKGEWIVDGNTGAAHKVGRGAGDRALSFLRPQDAVLSRKNGGAQYFERTGDLNGAIMTDRKNRGYNNYKEGKEPLPGFKNGFPGYLVPGLFGGLASVYQYFDAAHQKVKSPNTYRTNPNDNAALRLLGDLRVSQLPILRQLRNAEARTALQINMSGLTPAQKYIGRITAGVNTQNSIADALQKIQEANNQYKAQYANALMASGQTDRTAAMDAARWDLDYYSKAHAARQQGKQMGLYNFLNNLNLTYANAFKYNTYNKMYNLYNKGLDEDARKAYSKIMLSMV